MAGHHRTLSHGALLIKAQRAKDSVYFLQSPSLARTGILQVCKLKCEPIQFFMCQVVILCSRQHFALAACGLRWRSSHKERVRVVINACVVICRLGGSVPRRYSRTRRCFVHYQPLQGIHIKNPINLHQK